MINFNKILNFYLAILFVSFFIVITYFLGEGGKNLLQIGIMSISFILFPLYLLKYRYINKNSFFLFLLALLMFLVSFYKDSFRLATVLYSYAFILSFSLFDLSAKLNILKSNNFLSLIKGIIIAYFCCLVLQQALTLLKLPVFNHHLIFESNPFKLNSLTNEPSHLALFMFFLMYTYIYLKCVGNNTIHILDFIKQNKFIFFAYAYSMLTCYSSAAYIVFLLPFLRKMTLRNIFVTSIMFFILLFFVVDESLLNRTFNIINSLFTFSAEKVNDTDHSAAYRFLPFFAYIESIDFSTMSFWLGHGIDASKKYFSTTMFNISGDIAYDTDYNIGGFFGYLYDYGFICGMSFLIFAYKYLRKNKDTFFLIVWFIINIFLPFNSAILWGSLLLVCLMQIMGKRHENIC